MSVWFGLKGSVQRSAGLSGTVTLVAGARVLQIHAYASSSISSTVQIFSDAAAVTLPAGSGWWGLQENHVDLIAPKATPTIVFTSTQSYFVEWVGPPGAS